MRLKVSAAYRAAAWAGHWWAPERELRRGALERWRAWADARGPGPLVWIHAASVGEALTALPICRRLRIAAPTSAVIMTFTSASANAWPGGWPVNRADFLPPDLPRGMATALDALRPSLLVFSRADVWPELSAAAMEREVPVALIGASVRATSGRLGWPARRMFGSVYAGMAYVGAATASDADRLVRLGCRRDVIEVTGDPRHDQVLEQVPDGMVLRQLEDWAARGEVLVAGSTEPADEPVLLDAFDEIRRRRPAARLLVCPHHPRRVETVTTLARRRRINAATWSDGPAPDVDCLIVTRAGVLADLYALAALAYVGGGFDGHGLHTVLEPASYGVPVIMGPRGHGTDAAALLQAGGAVALPLRDAEPAMVRSWEAWLTDHAARARAGLAARRLLAPGAARRTASRLLALMHAA